MGNNPTAKTVEIPTDILKRLYQIKLNDRDIRALLFILCYSYLITRGSYYEVTVQEIAENLRNEYAAITIIISLDDLVVRRIIKRRGIYKHGKKTDRVSYRVNPKTEEWS